ncbi:patatin-like phospholipase family protein [Aureibaculum sp. 2210JD6-5]|nr:patatin-like phospholipase family protein [Aureibaculum sp. 2210JD6-5]MDY7395902.1 patatin-like phospholipase family protein [Aureibaculum sp. 2210JD6-5]
MHEGTCCHFSSGQLLKPLLASAALPPVFCPVRIDGYLYADGGIMNNFPIEPLLEKTDFIIGSYTTSVTKLNPSMIKNSFEITSRANSLMLYSNSVNKFNIPDILFKPTGLEYIGVLDKKGIEKAYIIGYDYASKYLENIIA